MTPAPDFQCLSASEKDDLIVTLLARLEVLEASNTELQADNAALREKLKLPPKTPRNSSTPPSRGHKVSGDGKAKPKGKVHAGAHRPLHPNPTRRRDMLAERCGHCQADVSGVSQEAVHAYDRIEIPEIVPDVTRVMLYGGVCPCCARRFKAAANMLRESGDAFSRQTSLIRERLLSGTILQSDETSARVGKKTWWTWVFHNGDSACFRVRPSRGKVVVEEFLGEVRPDFWVSDRLAAQMGWATTGHQACLAHLLRDVQYAIDSGDDAFAPTIKSLLKQAVAIGRRRDRLADSTLRAYLAKLEAKLDRLLRIEPPGEQGRKLLRIIKKYRQNLFVFVTNRELPPSRVDDWRGSGRSRGVAVIRRLSLATGASVRAVAPFPVDARQTGQADFPHPAFTHSIKPSLLAGRRGAQEYEKARAFHAGSPARIAQSRARFSPCASSTSVAIDDQRICGSGHRFP